LRNGKQGPLVSGGHDRHTVAVVTSDSDEQIPALPAIPVSAGALIFDRAGRLLILKPVYKSGWTISGGVMEADGESPWEACRREVREDLPARRPGRRAAAVARADPAPGARATAGRRLTYLEDGRKVPAVRKAAGQLVAGEQLVRSPPSQQGRMK
jgi:hypothetical protein